MQFSFERMAIQVSVLLHDLLSRQADSQRMMHPVPRGACRVDRPMIVSLRQQSQSQSARHDTTRHCADTRHHVSPLLRCVSLTHTNTITQYHATACDLRWEYETIHWMNTDLRAVAMNKYFRDWFNSASYVLAVNSLYVASRFLLNRIIHRLSASSISSFYDRPKHVKTYLSFAIIGFMYIIYNMLSFSLNICVIIFLYACGNFNCFILILFYWAM